MKATLLGKVIADSDDTVSVRGYDYFPLAAVRTEWLEKARAREGPRMSARRAVL
jgi:uncharacterized protein (DUF427 family)